jgi:hypothetical protein
MISQYQWWVTDTRHYIGDIQNRILGISIRYRLSGGRINPKWLE